MSTDQARSARLTFRVVEEDTARALGSGSVPVLSTPRLLAWCEAATCEVAASVVPQGHTTVGSHVELSHRAATPVGDQVAVEATLTDEVAGRLVFDVRATDGQGTVLATGEVTRAVVDTERFLARFAR